MEPIKAFSNVVIGQFVLTRIPIKVYVNGRYLTITSTDDVQDPLIGFGMDEDGCMRHFNYMQVEHLLVAGNEVTLDTYNNGMGATEEEPTEEPTEEEPKKEESTMKLGDILREVSSEEVDAEIEGAMWTMWAVYLAGIAIQGFRDETETPWRRGFGSFGTLFAIFMLSTTFSDDIITYVTWMLMGIVAFGFGILYMNRMGDTDTLYEQAPVAEIAEKVYESEGTEEESDEVAQKEVSDNSIKKGAAYYLKLFAYVCLSFTFFIFAQYF